MAPNITALPAKKLKELKAGETLTINYSESKDSVSRIINDKFPRAVATTFSSKWDAQFPPINKMKIADLQKPQAKSVTIIGGDIDYHRQVLSWMLSCCDGHGIKLWEECTTKPFMKYFYLRDSARIIGCAYLERLFTDRMAVIAERQIHSEDVRALYLHLPHDHEMISFLNEHIATRIWERRLKARSAYETLREEIPAFDAALNEILNAKIEERQTVANDRNAERQAQFRHKQMERNEKQRQAWTQHIESINAKKFPNQKATATAKTRSNDNGTKVSSSEHTTPPVSQPDVRVDDDGTIHAKLACEVVRRGQKGRPSYARLDLNEIGITKKDFVRTPYWSLRNPPRPKPKAQPKSEAKRRSVSTSVSESQSSAVSTADAETLATEVSDDGTRASDGDQDRDVAKGIGHVQPGQGKRKLSAERS